MPLNPVNPATGAPAALHAPTPGLEFLLDADLGREVLQLQALQIRQQLGRQSLSLANQAPLTIQSLFK